MTIKNEIKELQEAFVELFEKKSEKENYKNAGVFHDMNKDIETFYKKADEFIEKMKKNKEGKNLQEQLTSLKEAFDALFEVSGTEEDEKKQNVNKIKREKKVGPGKEPTEIVSVADELFPYEGSAKEQFNQKVIAKINDMIEGKATLEDLIQLVRQKKVAVREGFEGVEDIINIMEEMINEISKERADETTYKRGQCCRDLKSEYQRTRDSKVGSKYEEALVKDWKNSKLRDKWDILKGIKRGKDGEFHDIKDYKEYKEKHES